MRGVDKVDSQHLFPKVGESKTRGFKVREGGERYRRVQREGAISSLGGWASVWNELPEAVVEAGTILSF